MTVLEGIAVFWLLFGSFFLITGVVGIIRLPDAYARLHASGKVGALGVIGILLGIGFLIPSSFPKLILLGLFVTLTAPVASHAIAKADKSYSERQLTARDSSISAEGDQEAMEEEREPEAVST